MNSQRILSIDVSDEKLRYVYLEKEGNEYCVHKAGESVVDLDATSAGSLYTSVKNVLELENIRPQRVFLSVSRKGIIIHQLLIPKMSVRETDEVVGFEVEKIPGLANQDFEYVFKSYQEPKGKQRIIFAAMAKSELDYLLKEVGQATMPCKDLEIVPLNIKNIPPLIKASSQNEAVLVVHDSQIYLSVFNKKDYKLLYKISSGSSRISDYATAEERDRVTISWANEIKRVIRSYLFEHKENKLSKLWLIWDEEAVPGLDKRMAGELGIPVEPVDICSIPKIKTVENKTLNSIFALPMIPVIHYIHRIQTDFPLDYFSGKFQTVIYRTKVALAATAVIAMATVGLNVFTQFLNGKAEVYKTEAASMAETIQKKEFEAKDLFAKYNEYISVRERLIQQATYVQDLNRISWSEVLSVVANELPNDLALTSFKFDESGKADIKGEAVNMESVANMIRTIDESVILENGKFDYLKEKEIEDLKYFNFGILAKLKQEESVEDEQTEN